jgi:hypothetical protein
MDHLSQTPYNPLFFAFWPAFTESFVEFGDDANGVICQKRLYLGFVGNRTGEERLVDANESCSCPFLVPKH